jgi:hypothetical protein
VHPDDPVPGGGLRTPPEHDTGAPVLSVAEAARALGVTPATMRRRLRAGQMPGAVKVTRGSRSEWSIPAHAVLPATLLDERHPAPPAGTSVELARLRAERDRLAADHEALARRVAALVAERDELARRAEELGMHLEIARAAAFDAATGAVAERRSPAAPADEAAAPGSLSRLARALGRRPAGDPDPGTRS